MIQPWHCYFCMEKIVDDAKIYLVRPASRTYPITRTHSVCEPCYTKRQLPTDLPQPQEVTSHTAENTDS